MSFLINNIGNIARRLKDEFIHTSSELHHPGVKGSIREDILKETLRELIPIKYQFGSGIIVDANDKQSKQQDFILYDAFSSPSFLKSQTEVIIPIESVYATIEIKSTLDRSMLEQSVENIRSVKNLQKTFSKPQYLSLQGTNYIYSSIFAYTSSIPLDEVVKCLVKQNEFIPYEEQLSTICILDSGNVVNVQRNDMTIISTHPTEGTTPLAKPNELDQNLYLFYLMLQSHLNSTFNYPPDLWKYAKTNGSFIDKGIIIPNEAITDDLLIPLPGGDYVNGADHKRFASFYSYFFKILTQQLTDQDIESSNMTSESFAAEAKWCNEFFIKITNGFMKGKKE